jgi:hypothetical protein
VTVRLQGTSITDRELMVLGDFAVGSIEPGSAYPGQAIAIRGSGFTPQGMQVRFAGIGEELPYAFSSAREIRVYVPFGAQSGPLTVRSVDGRESATPFTVGAPPAGIGITALEPDCLRVRCRMIVHGYGFSRAPGRNVVTIGTERVPVRRAREDRLELFLPRRPGTMTIRIAVRGGGTVESEPLTVTP